MTTVDLVLRIAATLQLATLALLLASSTRGGPAARLGALFCASVIAFVVTSAPIRLGAIAYPLTALCVAKPALFWLFAKALFGERFRIRRAHGNHRRNGEQQSDWLRRQEILAIVQPGDLGQVMRWAEDGIGNQQELEGQDIGEREGRKHEPEMDHIHTRH